MAETGTRLVERMEPAPTLAASIQVWWLDLPSHDGLVARATAQLASEERARSARFRRFDDRRRFVLCRAALRRILAENLRVPTDEIHFTYGEFGRPRLVPLPGTESLDFNVAHSGDLGCIALCRDGAVGIDVEQVRPRDSMNGLLKTVLTPRETESWPALPDAQRLTTFFRYWTLKEALVKATGHGLQAALNEIEIDLEAPNRLICQPLHTRATPVFLQELDLGAGYCGALAAQLPERPIQIHHFPLDW